MKNAIKTIVLVFTIAAISIAQAEQPFTIGCPYDGASMGLDHVVGFGPNRVCWYSHQVWDTQTGHMVKHQAYIACPL